jgi:hypothetical protein
MAKELYNPVLKDYVPNPCPLDSRLTEDSFPPAWVVFTSVAQATARKLPKPCPFCSPRRFDLM